METFMVSKVGQGKPHFHELWLKNDDGTMEIAAWALLMYYMDITADIMFIYTFPKHRRKGYGKDLIEMIKPCVLALSTLDTDSTEEGREVCKAAGLDPEERAGIKMLTWRSTEDQKEVASRFAGMMITLYDATHPRAEVINAKSAN